MPRLLHSFPKYRLHKATGQAVVTFNGRDHYLGRHGVKASREKYDRLVGEWVTLGRCAPPPDAGTLDGGISVVELIAGFMRHARKHYRKREGQHTCEADNFAAALSPLKRLYGREAASKFGPMALRALRDEMIRLGWCRNNVNRQVHRVRHVFKWAAGRQLIPSSVYHDLRAVEALEEGRTDARETEPVRPVDESDVEKTLKHLPRVLAAAVQLQALTGMRPGEVCAMRGRDVRTEGDNWVYEPEHHKNKHKKHRRVVYLGPQARELVRGLLKPDLQAYLFSPKEAEAERHAEMHAKRKTPLSCGNRPGTNRKRKPKRTPGDRYDVCAYRRAIDRACAAAHPLPKALAKLDGETKAVWRTRLGDAKWKKVQAWRRQHRWHPHQLRHTAGTRFRKEFGVEAAQVLLGHKTLRMTELYAERNLKAAEQIMSRIG